MIRTLPLLLGALLAFPAAAEKLPAAEFEKALKDSIRDVNSRLPRMLDNDIRWEKVSGGNRRLRYHYTLVNYDAAQVDAALLKKRQAPRELASSCSPNMALYIENDVTLSYEYRGRDGREVMTITVTPAMCRQARR